MTKPPAPLSIQLPRPNLDPEPWPEASPWPWLMGASICILILACVWIRRRVRSRKPQPSRVVCEELPVPTPIESGNELLAERVRNALVKAFGPAWRARTTEEIAIGPELSQRYGAEIAGQVVAYLRAVDRAKFSDDPALPASELDWWASRFVEEVDTETTVDPAGATSKITGK